MINKHDFHQYLYLNLNIILGILVVIFVLCVVSLLIYEFVPIFQDVPSFYLFQYLQEDKAERYTFVKY